MDKKQVQAWVMYDWANSAYVTTMVAAVLPIFYREVAAANLSNPHLATAYWGYTQSIAMFFVAIMAPFLGAIADYSGMKMRFLRFFAYMGIGTTLLFVFVNKGDYLLASLLFIISTIGFSSSTTFYDSLLTDIVPIEKRDSVSSKGYAFGYIGGGILLVINMAMIQKPHIFFLPDTLAGTKLAFISVAIWWFIFSLPIFKQIKDKRINEGKRINEYLKVGFTRTWKTVTRLVHYPELFKFIVAFWFFNDGINTVITMATIYGKEIGIGTTDLIAALIITQFIGIPFTLLFGKIADRFGSKVSLYFSLSMYIIILIFGYFMTSAWQFYVLAIMVGFVQGGSQSIARSIFSKLVPTDRSAEFFGFLKISNKFSSIFGPLVFAVVAQWSSSSRYGILALVVFFIVGIAMLTRVNIEKGRTEAAL